MNQKVHLALTITVRNHQHNADYSVSQPAQKALSTSAQALLSQEQNSVKRVEV